MIFPPGRARLETSPLPTGSAALGGYDRNCRARLLGSKSSRTSSHDHVNFEKDQFGCQIRQPFEFPFGISVLKDNVFLFDIAKLSQPLAKCSTCAEKYDAEGGIKIPILGILAGSCANANEQSAKSIAQCAKPMIFLPMIFFSIDVPRNLLPRTASCPGKPFAHGCQFPVRCVTRNLCRLIVHRSTMASTVPIRTHGGYSEITLGSCGRSVNRESRS